MKQSRYALFVLMVGGMSALNPVSIDSFLPAIPHIAKELAVSPSIVGMSIGIYALGTAIGQLFYGPASDCFGRKPSLFFGLSLFIASAIAAAFAQSFEWLAIARFTQGLGAASGRILAMAIVRDKYKDEDAAKLLSYMMAVSGIMPIIGPSVGSILMSHLGWQSILIYMAIFGGVIGILSSMFLSETNLEKKPDAIHPHNLIINFRLILKSRIFLAYTACCALSGSGLYAFLSAAPNMIINTLGQGTMGFSYIFATIMTLNALSSLLGGHLVARYGIEKLISYALITSFLSVLVMAFLATSGIMTVVAIIAPFTIFKMSDTIIGSLATARALTPFPENAGAASSLIGFIRQSIGATSAVLVGIFYNGTSIPLALAILIAGISPGIIYYCFIKPKSIGTN